METVVATKAKRKKPSKPKGSPLTANGNGSWSKKIRGRVVYFGPWEDHAGALRRYYAEREELERNGGRRVRRSDGVITVHVLMNRFLENRLARVDAGDMTRASYDDYRRTFRLAEPILGRDAYVSTLTPDDFGVLRREWVKKGWKPETLAGRIQNVRTLFNFGWNNDLIAKPVRFGEMFDRPRKREIRRHRGTQVRTYTREEILRLLDAADTRARAWILLGINGGYGPTDLASLRISQVDFHDMWISHPRPKTALPRETSLWPATADALRQVIDSRPVAKDEADRELVFLNARGSRLVRDGYDGIGKAFRQLNRELGMLQKGRGIYALRRSFCTEAGAAKDPDALRVCMGHSDDSQLDTYRNGVSRERLQHVSNVVRVWLFSCETRK